MRNTSSALGLLSLVMKAFLLLISLPHGYAYNDGEVNRNGIAEKESFISAHHQKEVVYGSSIGTRLKMEQLGGRKMAVPRNFEMTKHKPAGSLTPQVISGRYDNNYKKIGPGGSQHQYIQQEQKKLEASIQKNSGRVGSPMQEQVHNTNAKAKERQESKATPTKSSWEGPKVAEKQRLVEEMVNLMHKDYKGVDKPRRKPPINNHVPIH